MFNNNAGRLLLMKRALLLIGLITLLFTGCSQQDIPDIQDKPPEVNIPLRHVSMQDAKEHLREILPEMTLHTRSSLNIGDGMAFNSHRQLLTRAQEDEALYYYFPIDNGTQYALMSARAELPQLLAIGNGTPDAQTLDELIPAVEDWSVATVGHNISITDTIGTIGTITDSTYVVRGEPVFIPVIAGGIDTTINNLCPVKWDQNGWFSQFCPEIVGKPGERANACCVATAVAQLFAAEKCRPTGYNGFTIDWDLLLSYPDTATMRHNQAAQVHIAELLIELGKKENLDVQYSKYGGYVSTAYAEDVSRTLLNFGFKNGGELVSFSEKRIINEFKRGYPVIKRNRTKSKNRPHLDTSWMESCHGARIRLHRYPLRRSIDRI